MKILDQWLLPDGNFARVIIDEEGDRIYQVSLNGENWLGVPMHDAVGSCLARAFEAMAELRALSDRGPWLDFERDHPELRDTFVFKPTLWQRIAGWFNA